MNDSSIGVNGGQVDIERKNNSTNYNNPLGLNADSTVVSVDSSPTLTNFSNISHFNAVIISSTSSPHSSDKSTTLIICSLAICLVAGLWLLAGYFVQELIPVYNAPAMLTYLSVFSLQFYFILIPKRQKFPNRRGGDGAGSVVGGESDLALDTYTNREVN